MKHFLGIKGAKKEDLASLLEGAASIKSEHKKGIINKSLEGKTLGMLFEKPSTRTRLSFEVGMTQLGGHAIFFDFVTSQISRGEPLSDTARVMGRYLNGIMARLYKQTDLEELAKYAGIPVINALTDIEHPCQALADVLTIKEHGKLVKGAKLAFLGDPSDNVANSLYLLSAIMGMEISLVGPAGYPPNKEFVNEASKYSKVTYQNDIKKGLSGADVVVTDVWVSMGQENEKAERLKAFMPYQLNKEALSYAKKDAIVLHCLPAHRGLEITADVIEGKQSVVWDEAENRLHVQKALMLALMAGKK